MQSFKQYLKEEQNDFEFWPQEDVMEWATGMGHRVLKKYNIEGVSSGAFADPKMENDMLNAIAVWLTDGSDELPRIGSSDLRHLPCQFGHIAKHFFVANCKLGSLKGAPITVEGKFSISNNPEITSIQYLPKEAACYVLRETGIKSFAGIHKIIKRILDNGISDGGEVYLPASTEHALLGFLKIPGCNSLELEFSEAKIAPPKLIKACEIISNHLQNGKNIIACQKELYDNDLDEYAEL